MKKRIVGIGLLSVIISIITGCTDDTDNNRYVNRFMGTGGNGGIVPVAAMPFGMVQLGPDTRTCGSGYHYDDSSVLGFSHVHKSGGGCSDFLDILFLPLPVDEATGSLNSLKRAQFIAPLSHDAELSRPGYYAVELYDKSIKVELTASLRCGLQRYHYNQQGEKSVIVDLEHGSDCGCSIVPEQNTDTVLTSSFEMVDDHTIRGTRVSSGWAPEQHVCFYTTFSQPIEECILFIDNKKVEGISSATGDNIKAILKFGDNSETLDIQTGISPVDTEGAKKNYLAESAGKSFEEVRTESSDSWNNVLGSISVETEDEEKKEIFYTSLFNVMLYPTLYSDVDNRYRGPDSKIHQTDGYSYYGGVMGFWDTFRAACPLQAIVQPKVTGEYVRTCLDHYKYAGQLPIWTLAGVETYQMIGLPAMPFITNAYMNGIKNFDTDYAMEAMRVSAMKDTCGFSMNYFVGLKNYKKFGYVPADLEMESVARTLEYAYADRAIAQFAKHTGHDEVYDIFYERSLNYQNVIDPKTKFARGRMSDGSWRAPFDPLSSEHRKDDYCEGNAWQWTFFVPHDVEGLAKILGGKEVLISRLDSLFSLESTLTGEDVSGDISGLIGQYAHGNEPGHHTAYMYNKLGEPRKAQYYINKILTTFYDTTPEGYCGNEDTGQMSAWYIFSSLGLYPMDPVSGRYETGAPLFDKASIQLPSGRTFTVIADNLSDKNIFVQALFLNGKKLNRNYITFGEVLNGGELRFEMTHSDFHGG